ncbi:MAG: hypothetical protein J5496_06575 [Lachnospiraceae bacterium]|nr:hypothetical protein [Lachnospiraceae bacterium]
MKKGKYYALRPWHFTGGASFSKADFQDFQYHAQRWNNCLWMYAFLIVPPVWIVLAFTVTVPRAGKMKKAANKLGILSERKDALARLETGRTAYTPTPAQLAEWSAVDAEAEQLKQEKQERKDSPLRKKKILKIWGIVLLFMAAAALIAGLATALGTEGGADQIGPLIAGPVMFAGIGTFLLIRASKIRIDTSEG